MFRWLDMMLCGVGASPGRWDRLEACPDETGLTTMAESWISSLRPVIVNVGGDCRNVCWGTWIATTLSVEASSPAI